MTPAASTTSRWRVEGMDCASCATKIENAVRRLPGITDVAVSVTGGSVTVTRDSSGVGEETIRNQISNLGYRVIGAEPAQNHSQGKGKGASEHEEGHSHIHDHAPSDQAWWSTRKGMLTIASGVALAAAFAVGKAAPATERWAFLLAMLVGLIPIARRAFSAARAGTPF